MTSWSPTPSYWVGAVPKETHRISTSPTEVVHVTIAFLVLTFDIGLVIGYLRYGAVPGGFNTPAFSAGIIFALAAALTGFVAHEMAHKFTAQRYGFWAEFRMSPVGLLVSLVTAFAGFLFAAPGATVVRGMGDTREWGRTSLAGPALNLAEGAVFFLASLVSFSLAPGAPTWSLLVLLAFINGWFAAFNLIPFGPLDGNKVIRWDRTVWVVSFGVAVAFTIYMYILLAAGRLPI